MLFKVIATGVAVTVAVLAAPTPDRDPRGERSGIAIPLIKHFSSLNNSDIIIRGRKSFERNTGTPQPSAVKREGSPSTRSTGAGVGLTNHGHEVWYGIISIGTPAKSFTVQFDTGSRQVFLVGAIHSPLIRPSDLIVPASTGNKNCRSHLNLWDPASSSTAKALNQKFRILFEDDAFVIGKQYTDSVTIAGFTADVQTIGVATSYSSEMAVSEFPPDGILGLAFPPLSEYHARSPLFHTLFSEGKLPQAMFSFQLTASGGELYVGGTNKALYIENSLTFTPVTVPSFWQVKIDNIKVNDKIVLMDVLAIIDTGANFIVGDPSRVLALHQAYGGQAFEDGYYTFPCGSFPSVTLTIGGKPYTIPGNILEQGRVESGSSDCFSGIVAPEDNPSNFWEVGAIFLQLFYTVFDFGSEPPQVGFAKLAS